MPLTAKGEKILKSMEETYGKEKAEQVLYASENKGTISGIHDSETDMTTVADAIKSCMDAVEGLHRRVDAYCARRSDEFHEQPAQDLDEKAKLDDHRVIGGVKL